MLWKVLDLWDFNRLIGGLTRKVNGFICCKIPRCSNVCALVILNCVVLARNWDIWL